MRLKPALHKTILAVHLASSVGWLGAVVAYLALDLTVAASGDATVVRGAWIAMGVIVSWVIVPLSLASLATGLAIAVATRWGLFRHWWVLISLALTIVAVVVLLSEAGLVTRMASRAADPVTSGPELLAIPSTLLHSLGGLVVLTVVLVLNVAKPQGLTPYGWRMQQRERRLRQATTTRQAAVVPQEEA